MGIKAENIRINGVEYSLSGSGSNVDIIDNLETADSQSALSANQGKVLNEKIETLETGTVIGEYDEETGTMKLEFNTPVQGIIEDTLESDNIDNALSAKQGKVLNNKITNVENIANEANTIAKGKNKARVFATTEAMNEWLSDDINKGLANVGDNLYIVDTEVPDWWISETLEEPNSDGRYYEIAQLETQKVDLTTINNAIADLENDVDEINSNLTMKFKSGTNCSVRYDKNWVHVRASATNKTLSKGVIDETTIILPDGVMPTYSFQLNSIVSDSSWKPIETVAYCTTSQGKRTISVVLSSDLNTGNIAISATVPRDFFNITE